MRKLALLTLMLVFSLGVSYSWAQETPTAPDPFPNVIIPDTEAFTLTSASTGRDYPISVGLPDSYTSLTSTYPVLYLLDPSITFGTATAFARLMVPDELPALLIVGIGYININQRGTDYDREADQFLSFISDELIPYIDSHYRTNTEDRAIAGYSIGGQFVLHTLWSQPELFKRYIALSPGTPPEFENVLAGTDEAFRNNLSGNDIRLFIGAGSTEYIYLGDQLRKQNYEGLTVSTFTVDKGTHLSSLLSSLPQGIIAIYCGENVDPTSCALRVRRGE